VHLHVSRVRVVADHPNLVGHVERAQLSALGNGDDLWHRPVLVVSAPRLPVDQLRRELAVRCGHGQQLEPAHPLGRAAFVHVDVCTLGANHRTPSIGNRLKRNDVGAGPVEYRECLPGCAEVLLDDPLQVLGVDVIAVRDLVPVVGEGQGGKHLGVNPGVVIARESSYVRIVTTPGICCRRVHVFFRSVSRLTGFPSSSQFAATFLLGCTRGGSPGIFG